MDQTFFGDFLNSFRGSPHGDSHKGIPSPEEFSRILERERERSDRSGQGFSLVVFESGVDGRDSESVRILIDSLLSRRVRAIDEVGWFKAGAIAAALPSTSPEGAWKFAKDVCHGVPPEIPKPVCRVYSYPSSWASGGNGRGDGRKQDIPENNVQENTASTGSPRTETMQSCQTAEVQGLETVLGRPIPPGKRFLDILGALAGLILFSPLFLLIAAFIKLVSPGPVFYRQERIGYLGRPFTFWKFRTMHVNSDATEHKQYLSSLIGGDAPMVKLDEARDSRIIPFGNVLRRTCLDEIPQLINVLLGDMSLVGPRPCLPYEAEKYLQWHARRFDIVPGMTGLWQVSGKNRLTFREMIRLDIRYSRKMSPWLDANILLLTGPAILGFISEPLAREMGTGQERLDFSPSGRG
jgi:lipopolysaccharide/colanic/teichoic acid biosynthesis glycosyltransferase